jgi:uncharacterized phiE125 gp8 family phage protein
MYELNTAPVKLPITLAEVRNELKIDSDNVTDDALLFGLIRASVDACEAATRLSLITQTWTLWLDGFSKTAEPCWDGVRDGALSELNGCKRQGAGPVGDAHQDL